MSKRLAVGTALTVVLVGLGCGYVVLRAPSGPVAVMPTPAAPSLWTPSEPIQPQAMLPRPNPCYTLRVIPPGLDCHPPGRYEARPESRMHKSVVETIHGQRRIVPSQSVTVETIKAGNSTEGLADVTRDRKRVRKAQP